MIAIYLKHIQRNDSIVTRLLENSDEKQFRACSLWQTEGWRGHTNLPSRHTKDDTQIRQAQFRGKNKIQHKSIDKIYC